MLEPLSNRLNLDKASYWLSDRLLIHRMLTIKGQHLMPLGALPYLPALLGDRHYPPHRIC